MQKLRFFLLLICAFPVNLFAGSDPVNHWELISYNLEVRIDPATRHISGLNRILLTARQKEERVRLKLFSQFQVHAVYCKGRLLQHHRDSIGFTIDLLKQAKKGDSILLEVHYAGAPPVAKKAPWDGGVVWASDSAGKPWAAVACEGIGASCWMPCKDTWDDEPEKIKVKLIVPEGLKGVSNGKLTGQRRRTDSWQEFDWEVCNPINHYNITFNVGDYVHLEDVFVGEKNKQLSLNYYVLRGNQSKARTHFQQVKRMLQSFEQFFGPYPFYEDGYKLVETPYWGMEHQSCVAYGNNYQNNRFGFDFIIIHESGHEWFANSITVSDPADMWVQEGFTTYSEALYVERQFGNARAVQYLLGQKGNIKNNSPLIGPKGVNFHRSDNDCYYKGTWMLHTLRTAIGNDSLWFNSLRDLSLHFRHQITTSAKVEEFLSMRTGQNLKPFFNQYLRNASLPVFEYYILHKDGLNELHYRLSAEEKSLKLPVKVAVGKEKFDYVEAKRKWQIIDLPYADENAFMVDEKSSLITVRKVSRP